MLDIKWIRENPQALDEALKKRGAESSRAGVMLSASRIACVSEGAQGRRRSALTGARPPPTGP